MQGRSKGSWGGKEGALALYRSLFQQSTEEHLPNACVKSKFESWTQPLPSCILSFRSLTLLHYLSVICILSAPPGSIGMAGHLVRKVGPLLDPNLLTQNVTRLPRRFAGSAGFEKVCSALTHQQIQLPGEAEGRSAPGGNSEHGQPTRQSQQAPGAMPAPHPRGRCHLCTVMPKGPHAASSSGTANRIISRANLVDGC